MSTSRPTSLLLCLLLLPTTSEAAPVQIDWARGLVIADGVGLADRHAPNPAVARGTSRRSAEDAARKRLAGSVRALPLASGGTVSDAAKRDPELGERLERAVRHAITLTADPQTDGAWRVTMAVPIEAVRQALTGGPRPVAADASDDASPPVVVVEGVGGRAPAVGWTVGGIAGATVWVSTLPAWAKDAPRVTAAPGRTGAKATGDIDAPGITGGPATLFVIVTGRGA